jgi:D-arabinose 1-dehydrogenase-like Zn-dependent alcohol dehydrogenase
VALDALRRKGQPAVAIERNLKRTVGQALKIAFAAEGKVHAQIHRSKLDHINQVFSDLKAGKIDGRMVLMM